MEKKFLQMLDRINSFLAQKLGWGMSISGFFILGLIVFLIGEIVGGHGKIAVVAFVVITVIALLWPEEKKNLEVQNEK